MDSPWNSASIWVGRTLKTIFFNENSWKIVENRQNRLPDPRTYYGDPHCNFWLGTFSPRNFPDPKQSPEQKWGSECSDQAKKWVGSAQGWYLKNCRTDFFVFVSCSKKTFFSREIFQKSQRFRTWRTQCQRDPHCKRPFGEGLREISRLQRVARAKVGVKLLRLG